MSLTEEGHDVDCAGMRDREGLMRLPKVAIKRILDRRDRDRGELLLSDQFREPADGRVDQ
jgi:hypothetical protein